MSRLWITWIFSSLLFLNFTCCYQNIFFQVANRESGADNGDENVVSDEESDNESDGTSDEDDQALQCAQS